jgi:hypothetical protein
MGDGIKAIEGVEARISIILKSDLGYRENVIQFIDA